MSQQRPYKRRLLNLGVNREMQLRMIGKITCILFVSLLISSAVYFFFANQEITSSFKLFHIKARNFLDYLLPVVVSSFFISLIVGVFASLFFPKSLAGGLYRIEREVEQVIKGDLTVKITLRRGDESADLAAKINEMIHEFRKEMTSIQSAMDVAKKICFSETEMTPEVRIEELKKIHTRIISNISKLKLH